MIEELWVKFIFSMGLFFVIRKEVFLRNDGNPPFKWGGKKNKANSSTPTIYRIG